MAKIVFFNDSRNISSAQSLFEQQLINHAAETSNEIYLVTDNDDRTYHSKVQIMKAFQKWNLFEAARFAPILFQMRADIFHFFQPARLGLSHPFPILAAFARSSQTRNFLSLFGSQQEFSRGLQVLISECSRVSVIDPQEAIFLNQRFPSLQIEILPVQRFRPVEQNESFKQSPPERFLFLPENLDRYRNPEYLIRVLTKHLLENPDLYLVCSGSLLDFKVHERRKILNQFASVAGRTLWTGPLNRELKLKYMRRAQVVIVASLIHSPLLIFESVSLVLAANAVSIFELRQIDTAQLKFRNNVHAKLIELSQIDEALSELLADQTLREVLRKNLAAVDPTEEQDDLANRLSRAYVKLLEQEI